MNPGRFNVLLFFSIEPAQRDCRAGHLAVPVHFACFSVAGASPGWLLSAGVEQLSPWLMFSHGEREHLTVSGTHCGCRLPLGLRCRCSWCVSRMCRECVQSCSMMLQDVEHLDRPKSLLRMRFREMLETVARWLRGLLIRKSWVQVPPPEPM